MFVCDDCIRRKGWYETIFKSYGPCEICHEIRACNDINLDKIEE
jgi:hypothetical protein